MSHSISTSDDLSFASSSDFKQPHADSAEQHLVDSLVLVPSCSNDTTTACALSQFTDLRLPEDGEGFKKYVTSVMKHYTDETPKKGVLLQGYQSMKAAYEQAQNFKKDLSINRHHIETTLDANKDVAIVAPQRLQKECDISPNKIRSHLRAIIDVKKNFALRCANLRQMMAALSILAHRAVNAGKCENINVVKPEDLKFFTEKLDNLTSQMSASVRKNKDLKTTMLVVESSATEVQNGGIERFGEGMRCSFSGKKEAEVVLFFEMAQQYFRPLLEGDSDLGKMLKEIIDIALEQSKTVFQPYHWSTSNENGIMQEQTINVVDQSKTVALYSRINDASDEADKSG